MKLQDRMNKEAADMMNDLETYILDMRSKISYSDYLTDGERESMKSQLDEGEYWLDDHFDDTKGVYKAKLDEMKKVCEKFTLRSEAASTKLQDRSEVTREDAITGLENVIALFKGQASGEAEEYAHIEGDDKKKVLEECETIEKWLSQNKAKQSSLAKTDDPVLFAAELVKKNIELENKCKPIMSKPKPAPPPPVEEKKDEDKPMEDVAAAPQAEPTAEPKSDSAKDMDVD